VAGKKGVEKIGFVKCIVLACNFASSTILLLVVSEERDAEPFLAKDSVPHSRGVQYHRSSWRVARAMVNADRDFVQHVTARFWHRHDVVRTALRVFVLVKFGFLVKFGISCPFSFSTFAISVVSASALSGQLDAGSDACEGDIRLKCSFQSVVGQSGRVDCSSVRSSVVLLPSRFENVAFLCP